MKSEQIYLIAVNECKPNPLFTERQHSLTRFLRFSGPVPCAECGRRSRTHWTQLGTFSVMNEYQFSLQRGEKVHLPMSPVCTKHILTDAELPLAIPKAKKARTA